MRDARLIVVVLLLLLGAACQSAQAVSLRRHEREVIHRIGQTLHDRWEGWMSQRPADVRLSHFMGADELTDLAVHCSDFSIALVTASKRDYVYYIEYLPHLPGQPKAFAALCTIVPFGQSNEIGIDEVPADTGRYQAARSWGRDKPWDNRFYAHLREQRVTGAIVLLSLPVGLVLGFFFAIWLVRLRINFARQRSPSGHFLVAMGGTFFALILGIATLPMGAWFNWALIAYLLPSTLVVFSGLTRILFDRLKRTRWQQAFELPDLPGAFGRKRRSRFDVVDTADGYRLSWYSRATR